MQLQRILAVGFCVVSCSMAAAADWPQWRGPDRDGVSKESGLLKEWPKEGPKLVWHIKDIGNGYSTPSVVGDRLYVNSNKGVTDEFIQALDVADGKQAWQVKLGKVGPNGSPQYPAARSTPTVDGGLVYALGSDGDLLCLDAKSGDVRWRKNLRKDFDGKPGRWAYAESPLVDGDAVICTPGGASASIVALNKQTGDTIWKCPVPGGDQAGYASAMVDTVGGVRQYVQFLQKGLVGVDAKTGKFLWRYDKTAAGSPANIPTPVIHDNCVYTATRGHEGLIRLSAENGTIQVKEIYLKSNLPAAIGGAVVVGDYLYGTNAQGLLCANFMTGDIKWQNRGIGVGSICFADGHLYLHGENGKVALVEAVPNEYRQTGVFSPPDEPNRGKSRAWAYPVVADGRLYIRDMGSLWCYDVRGQVASK